MSDMTTFRDEVLVGGAEACLPCNLSDRWLSALLIQAEREDIDLLTAAVLVLLCAKTGGDSGRMRIDHDELVERLREYQVELGLEQVGRATDVRTEPATLETIFTNRRLYRGRSVL